jgi:uncharacterized protein Usg
MAELIYRYHLTTAHILYHMPDHPSLLQTFVWQDLDLAPEFPSLKGFLKYWERNIEGKLHSVTIGNSALNTPADLKFFDGEFRIH